MLIHYKAVLAVAIIAITSPSFGYTCVDNFKTHSSQASRPIRDGYDVDRHLGNIWNQETNDTLTLVERRALPMRFLVKTNNIQDPDRRISVRDYIRKLKRKGYKFLDEDTIEIDGYTRDLIELAEVFTPDTYEFALTELPDSELLVLDIGNR